MGRDVFVAGIVTDAQHRISKMGKGWGIFRLEDFRGDYEFKMFGEDYLKFRHFFENESCSLSRHAVANSTSARVKASLNA